MLVATEAAGEGINLQFCWFMINYDIPWNPVRLEQRMGRIHRYGQEHDCLIFNFVATNTREGRVLQKLLDRLARDPRRSWAPTRSSTWSARSSRRTSWRRCSATCTRSEPTSTDIQDRIVEDVDPERFRAITESTLEGLAKRELNLSAIVGKSVEAKERRLVPEVIEDFFVAAAPHRWHSAEADEAWGAHVSRGQGARGVCSRRATVSSRASAGSARSTARSPSTRIV